MKLQARIIFIGLVLGSSLLSRVAAQQGGAEQLYRSNQGQGLKISIELKRGNVIRMVSAQTTFLTGDQIKLHFTANFDGYVYAMNEAPSGKTTLLFPTEETGTANLVEAGRDYTIPATDGWFRLVGRPGVETIHMIASGRPLPEMDAHNLNPDGLQQGSARPPKPMPTQPVPEQQINQQAPAVPAAQIPPLPQPTPLAQPAVSPVQTPANQNPPQQKQQKTPSAYSQVQKDVGKVKGGISLGQTITSMPKNVIGMFGGMRPRDLVLEDDQQEGITYVSSATLSEKPVYFIVELVHQ